jgi:hypothetical protein
MGGEHIEPDLAVPHLGILQRLFCYEDKETLVGHGCPQLTIHRAAM